MTQVALYAALATVGVVAIWQLVVWMIETGDKNRKYRAACGSARARGKPLLVVGGPWGSKPARHWFNKPAHGSGDVCLDIDRRAIEGHPCAVVASVTHVPFRDSTFGAAFASHLLEHLPTVGDACRALQELNRVADGVYVVCPSRQSVVAWVMPGHHLWVWQDGERTFLKQRGGSRGIEVYRC